MEQDIMKLDLYAIIGIIPTATEEEIKKAYRKQALKCHPDKNPDNPKAAEEFRQLTKVLEVLTDASARAAYDKILNAKAQAKLRFKELDARRKRFKDNLEAREAAFDQSQSSDYYTPSKSDEQRLKAELERLKKEGSRLVEEENERLRQKVLEELRKATEGTFSEDACRVKISWRVNADDSTNGGYNHDNLTKMLSKHGDVSVLVISSAKKGRALVEFTTQAAAESAVSIEKGLITNPLKLTGIWEKKKTAQSQQKNSEKPIQTNSRLPMGGSLFASIRGNSNVNSSSVSKGLSFASAPDIFNTQPPNHADFESTVLNNLKKAEERRKLIAQMQAEDAET